MSHKPDMYPEHAKLAAVAAESQAIGEFLDFGLPGQGLVLAELVEDMLVPAGKPIRDILARYFSIDQEALEHEKRTILEEMRAMSGCIDQHRREKAS